MYIYIYYPVCSTFRGIEMVQLDEILPNGKQLLLMSWRRKAFYYRFLLQRIVADMIELES